MTPPAFPRLLRGIVCATMLAVMFGAGTSLATPANKAALEKHFDRFLAKDLSRCTTCHLPSDRKAPESLEEFPHNPFGHRLRILGEELAAGAQKGDMPARLALIASEDSDKDGVDNETEILLGHNPGDAKDKPGGKELAGAAARRAEFTKFLASYRWQPFEPVRRPAVPTVKNRRWVRNPVDAFLAAEHEARRLAPRTEASREVLLRRVTFDLIGLAPTPEEQRAFLTDTSPDAYERLVDRLLDDPRHGERWGRHWMDVWRYSDWAGWTDGGQVRDSQPHIWRWRDWIVESLNADQPYDRMVMEMLAADELAPEDTNALRATGFLVRNYKMLSREQWLEDTIKHTSMAFLGVTVGCAKCHDHMYDPVSQKEYYQMRAIFEPHQVRTDRVPGQTNTTLDGLVRVFDVATNAPTWFLNRGDERHPDTNHVIAPGVPRALGGALRVEKIGLPHFAARPDDREFVIRDTIAAGDRALAEAREVLAKLRINATAKADRIAGQELTVALAEARQSALLATVEAERLDEKGDAEAWRRAATNALAAQRLVAVQDAKLKLHTLQTAEKEALAKLDSATNAVTSANATNIAKAKPAKDTADKAAKEIEAARKKTAEAATALAEAEKEQQAVATTAFKRRPVETYPAESTGRRLAFARWVADAGNPLTARVAMNQIWLRHFGRGLVPTPSDFGRNGRPPSHPALLDWLAAEFTAQGWSMKAMHRLLVTSSAYRLSSTPDEANAAIDPDNIFLWRMNSRRLEAEAVRDNLLWVGGQLDLTMGGPDIDHKLGLTSKRRSLYLRTAAEKEVEFLKIFDGPSVTECYERKPSVMPQQALALANSELAFAQARALVRRLMEEGGDEPAMFVPLAFRRVLARRPTREEARLCAEFLARQEGRGEEAVSARATPIVDKKEADSRLRSREHLILVLMNQNDFVTIR